MKLRAIQDKVIVKAQDAEKETSGGIIIANAQNEGITKGQVLSIGPGAYDETSNKFIATTTQIGDMILFNLGGGVAFTHNDEEYVTITEKEIIAVVA
jgi:chaperonin GroES|tara:strand:- start:45 stop:335 length:291 start_codon:yes stop_codon:yes gene_type:complete